MLRRSRLILAATALSITTVALAAQAAFKISDKSALKIDASANMIGAFTGKCTGRKEVDEDDKKRSRQIPGLSMQDDGTKLTFTADLRGVDVGIRDSHLHDVFKTGKDEKFEPDGAKEKEKEEARQKRNRVTLVVERGKLNLPADGASASGNVKGALTIRGKTKEVTVNYKISRAGKVYTVTDANFTFKYPEFGFAPICKAVVCVKDDVKITLPKLAVEEK
jgi:hypothetical protein